MPRSSGASTKVQQMRAYVREHKMSYDAAYHLSLAAVRADGKSPIGLEQGAPDESSLSSEDKSALASAKSALGLE